MQEPFILILSLLTVVAMLLQLLIVRGKPTFEDARTKRTYYGLTAAAFLPGIAVFLLLIQSLDRPMWVPALSLMALSLILNALIERRYVRETREHWQSGIMAVLMVGLAAFFYIGDLLG